MKILITGAGGNLGRVLAPALTAIGHEPIMMDYRKLDTPYPFIQGDVTDKEAVLQAAQNVDVIVHAAALHGIHLSHHSRDDFWKLNVSGTHNIYQAALELGIRKVLLCSTMGVYGESIQIPPQGVAEVTEDLPLLPRDFYGHSKKLCEEIAAFYSRCHQIRTVAFRLGMFVPENFIRYGFRLLKGGVDDRDVAQAFLLALQNDSITFDAFNIMAEVPFTRDQFVEWRGNPQAMLESRFPGISLLAESQGANLAELANLWRWIHWSVDKAKEKLGYRPQYNFGQFYAAWRENNTGYYPYAGLPWWGIPSK